MAEGFERNDFVPGEVLDLVDDAHSARSETPQHREPPGAGKVLASESRRRQNFSGSLHERRRPLVRVQQAQQFRVERGIVPTCSIDVSLTRGQLLRTASSNIALSRW